MSEWKAKSPATENWDDDYLFQTLAPSASLPSAALPSHSGHTHRISYSREILGPTPPTSLPLDLAGGPSAGRRGQRRGDQRDQGSNFDFAGRSPEAESNPGLGLGLDQSNPINTINARGEGIKNDGNPKIKDTGGQSSSEDSEELDWDAEDAVDLDPSIGMSSEREERDDQRGFSNGGRRGSLSMECDTIRAEEQTFLRQGGIESDRGGTPTSTSHTSVPSNTLLPNKTSVSNKHHSLPFSFPSTVTAVPPPPPSSANNRHRLVQQSLSDPSRPSSSFIQHRTTSSHSQSPPPKSLALRSDNGERGGRGERIRRSYDDRNLPDLALGLEDERSRLGNATSGSGTIRPKTASVLSFLRSSNDTTDLTGGRQTEKGISHERRKSGHTRRSSQPFATTYTQPSQQPSISKPGTPIRTSSQLSNGQMSGNGDGTMKRSESTTGLGLGNGNGNGSTKTVKPRLMSRLSSFHKRLSSNTTSNGTNNIISTNNNGPASPHKVMVDSPGLLSPSSSAVGPPSRRLKTNVEDHNQGRGCYRGKGSVAGLLDGGMPLDRVVGVGAGSGVGFGPALGQRTGSSRGEIGSSGRPVATSPTRDRGNGGLSTWSYPRLPSAAPGSGITPGTPPFAPRRSSSRSDLGSSPSTISILDEAPPVPPLPVAHRTSSRATDRSSASGTSVNVQNGRLPTSSSMTSLGFHLPSPNPGSPYHPANSSSFSQPGEYFGSEQEVATPKRTKIRPTSHIPVSRAAGIPPTPILVKSESMQTLATTQRKSRTPPKTAQSAKGVYPWDAQLPSPVQEGLQDSLNPGKGAVSRSRSTLQRLSSISKRHGRKISDGWRIASGASARSTETMTTPAMMSSSVMTSVQPEVALARVETPPNYTHSLSASASLPMASLSPHYPALPLRSLSQNDSPSASRTSTRTEEVLEEPIAYQRRNSLSDLRIPMTVAKAQAGLKRGLVAVKLFAEGVEDLKRLLDKRDELRLQGIDLAPSPEDEQWWDMATLLVQLGDSPMDGDNAATSVPPPVTPDMKRDRRITLASGTPCPAPDSTSQHLASSPGKLGLPKRNEAWRASTGRRDLTPNQLDALRQILNKPEESQSPSPARLGSRSTLASRGSDSGSPPSTLSGRRFGGEVSAMNPPTATSPSVLVKQRRRGSRSALSAFRDFIKPASGNKPGYALGSPDSLVGQRPEPKYSPRNRHSKTQSRPSLASVFRKSSSHFSPTMPHPLGSSVSSSSSAAPSWRVEEEYKGDESPSRRPMGTGLDLPPVAPDMLAVPATSSVPSNGSGSVSWAASTAGSGSGSGTWSASSLLSIKRAFQIGESEEFDRSKPLMVTPDRLPALTQQVETVRSKLEALLAAVE